MYNVCMCEHVYVCVHMFMHMCICACLHRWECVYVCVSMVYVRKRASYMHVRDMKTEERLGKDRS